MGWGQRLQLGEFMSLDLKSFKFVMQVFLNLRNCRSLQSGIMVVVAWWVAVLVSSVHVRLNLLEYPLNICQSFCENSGFLSAV